MIPKIIHLCWLSGDPYPSKIKKCIKTWGQYLSDYKIVLWDTNKFDINSSLWVRQAFEKKKYAFAADYIRFYALYHYGGIYLDSDVEVLKNFDVLLDLPYFIGAEKAQTPEAAIIGAEKGCDWVKQCLDYYQDRPFVNEDGSLNIQTVPEIMIKQIEQIKPVRVLSIDESLNIRKFDMQKEFLEFNDAFFSPKVFDSRVVEVTPYTFAIHHYQNSWFSSKARAYYRLRAFAVRLLGWKYVRYMEVLFIPWKFKKKTN